MSVPAFYFSSLDISIITFAFFFSITDMVSFAFKPFLGYLTDKYGEKQFMLGSATAFVLSLFLIGQTQDVVVITVLRIVSGVSSALLFMLLIIYGLREVRSEPERDIGRFNAVFQSGWLLGLFIPGLLVERFGITDAFNALLVVGLFWILIMYRLAIDQPMERKVTASFSYLKRIPLLVVYKSMDLAAFTTFLYFFTRFALKQLGLPSTIISTVIALEVACYVVSNFFVGRISNKGRRRYWIPLAVVFHLGGAVGMILGSALPHYFLSAAFIGIAGGFIDIWLFSLISETVKRKNKGRFLATFGWSYEIGTIVGAQAPVLFVLLHLSEFAALILIPLTIGSAYLFTTLRSMQAVQ
jgi:MFS family permease